MQITDMKKSTKTKLYTIKPDSPVIVAEKYMDYDVMEKSEKGISINYLNHLSDKYALSPNDWALIMGISTKSIQRYQQQENILSAAQTEFVLKIEQLYALGEEVFGNLQNFKGWMQKPAFGLGGKIPAEILHTISGINLVINQLMRIAHGVLA